MPDSICDGCGRTVDESHIRERIQRLEAATRFRPLHIATLLVGIAPPANLADDFYWLEAEGAPSPEALLLQQALLEAVGVQAQAPRNRARELSEFQRAGLYLAHLFECPLPGGVERAGTAAEALASQARSLATRIRFSYKPKRVVLLGSESHEVDRHLKECGLGELLASSGPVPLAKENDVGGASEFRRAMAMALAEAPRATAPE